MIEFIIKYILDEDFINKAFIVAAIAGPIAGIFAGIIVDRYKKTKFRYTIIITSIGFFGTINFILWKLYNLITDYFGLATVKNLAFNLLFFIVFGLVLGVLYTLLFRFVNRIEIDDSK